MEDLAAEAGYSPNHFLWIFHATTGQTPIEYVRQRRIIEAARAILAGDGIVDTVPNTDLALAHKPLSRGVSDVPSDYHLADSDNPMVLMVYTRLH